MGTSISFEIKRASEAMGALLLERRQTVTVAESCTGGGVAKAITAVAGSSQWFDCSFVSYSNSAKQRLLGVPAQLIESFGAVSVEVAEAMAFGAAAQASADLAMAVTGIAGPGGGSVSKPVGTVCLAWVYDSQVADSHCFHFDGSREEVREQSIKTALERACQLLR